MTTATAPTLADRCSTPNTNPTAPSAAPKAIPPATDPAEYQAAVTPHRLFLARSPSGLMLASIDSPQGDQVDRIAATTASGTPRTTATALLVTARRPRRRRRVARGRG